MTGKSKKMTKSKTKLLVFALISLVLGMSLATGLHNDNGRQVTYTVIAILFTLGFALRFLTESDDTDRTDKE